jgi:antirestriction protein ArdC
MRIYENVTHAFIEAMDRGAVPWVRPWKTNRHNAGKRGCTITLVRPMYAGNTHK